MNLEKRFFRKFRKICCKAFFLEKELTSNFKTNDVSIESIFSVGIENPVSKKIYEEVNEKVENRTKWMYLAIVQASIPGLLLSNFMVSFYIYFTSDLGNESFMLPFPVWWVLSVACWSGSERNCLSEFQFFESFLKK